MTHDNDRLRKPSDVERLLAEATPLPWGHWQEGKPDPLNPKRMAWGGDNIIVSTTANTEIAMTDEDRDLIVYAVNRLPAYEAAVEALGRLLAASDPHPGSGHNWTIGPGNDFTDARSSARAALARLREKVPA